VVDTFGLLITIVVHPANVQDRDGGVSTLQAAKAKEPTLKRAWGDAAYRGQLVERMRNDLGIEIEIVSRQQEGFEVLPWRWIVERTFSWINRYRRLSKDYEGLLETAESFIWVALVRLLVSRLADSSESAAGLK